MARKSTTPASIETVEPVEAPATPAIVIHDPLAELEQKLQELEPATPEQEAADDAEIEEQIELPRSVVKSAYKRRYKDAARARGDRKKAAKRSKWDWLAQSLAAICLDKHSKVSIPEVAKIAILNGIEDPEVLVNGQFNPDASRWPSQSKGWEGRYRMTVGLVLRPLVADAGVLLVEGEELVPPEEWRNQYRTDR